MPFQKMYISQAMEKVDPESGKLTDETTRRYVQRYVRSFIQWVDQVQQMNGQ